MNFSSSSMTLILGLIYCGATYALFSCNNPAYPGPHQPMCSRLGKPSDISGHAIPPRQKGRMAKQLTYFVPAAPSDGKFTCGQVSVRGFPSERRRCCNFDGHVQPNDFRKLITSMVKNYCYDA
ncbi:hypothetical protein MJO28_013776 [Puccinia striiformis f. sp. tritici]|uniref:Uncharacterized protein n=1 Tax=Puccinia striiformis f. sp. tritici TaxID=168172 RepID=A0ACC0DXF4_9BASI|nr:hypothetical protein MJO28_013776 [Puccinia striiformis f. sp. tritici]